MNESPVNFNCQFCGTILRRHETLATAVEDGTIYFHSELRCLRKRLVEQTRELNEARAAYAAMRCSIGTAHAMLGEMKHGVARRLLGRILAGPNPGQPLLDRIKRLEEALHDLIFEISEWNPADINLTLYRAALADKPDEVKNP